MKKGYAVLGTLGLVTVISWLSSSPTSDLAFTNQLSQLLGGLALVGFACLMVIATRISLLDSLFDGLDKAYVAHKWLAIVSVGLVLAHLVTREPSQARTRSGPGGRSRILAPADPAAADATAESPLIRIGVLATVLFVALILLALLAKKFKHERWKAVHTLMVVPYAIGLAHYYGASSYNPAGLAPFSLWMDLVAVAGVVAAVYSIALYERIGFSSTYQITGLRSVADRTVEVTGRAVSRPLHCRPGQFAFVKIPGRRFPSHPFTLSRVTADEIRITVKALGDRTSFLVTSAHGTPTSRPTDSVQIGDRLFLSRAHGRFDYTTGSPRQVWIAGGIGITPFCAFLYAGVPAAYSIDLFYSYDDETGGAYLDDLRSFAAPNIRVHLVNALTDGRLTAAKIAETVDLAEPLDAYFCGPKPMRDTLKKALRNTAVKGFHFEEFQFGR